MIMRHLGLIWISLSSTTVVLLIICAVVACRRRRRQKQVGSWLPDFVILDRGDSIHLVPLEGCRHRIDNTGRCHCKPLVSINQRRLGSHVRYVDHHLAGAQPIEAVTRHPPRPDENRAAK
jgi:hypothetical protein